jgi:hypothetical protein
LRRAVLGTRISVFMLLFLFLIISIGCVKKEAIKISSDEEVLRERVMAYWNYRVKQELDKTYEFEDPIYRKSHSIVSYIKKFGVDPIKLKEVKINGLQMEDGVARIDLRTRVELRAPGSRKPLAADADRNDRWGKIDGIWYHVIGGHSDRSGDKK